MKFKKGDRVVAVEDGISIGRDKRIRAFNYQKGDKGTVIDNGRKIEWDKEELNTCIPLKRNIKKIEEDKFKTGEKVKYIRENVIAEVFGAAPKKDDFEHKYAITYISKRSGDRINTLVSEDYLGKIKKKDELEVGDKFICGNEKYEILDVSHGRYPKVYWVKNINTNGRLHFYPEDIDEVI